jgi:AP endonuclease-1
MGRKLDWQQAFELEVRRLDALKPVIWAGDVNCAPESIDLTNPKPNWNKTAGHTAQETNFFRSFLNPPEPATKFVDVWRRRNPTRQTFTYFSFGRGCREKGIGWRLDMFVVSERLYDRVRTCDIRAEVYGPSDHLPIVMEIEGEL